MTLFNFKLYSKFMKNAQGSPSKSKKISAKKSETLTEILVHLLRHSYEYLRNYCKSKVKTEEEMSEFYKERQSQMCYELLENLAMILTTYKVDEPIMEPALKLFDLVEFAGIDSPDQEVINSVLSELLLIYERETNNENSQVRKIVYIAFTKL